MQRKNALLILDMQNDFCPGGALETPGSDELVPVINRYIEIFRAEGATVYASREYNEPNPAYSGEPEGASREHCVKGTFGAEFHPDLEWPKSTVVITRRTGPSNLPGSAFNGIDGEGVYLETSLKARGVTHIYMGGLAVKDSALAGLARGFAVTLLTDAVKGLGSNEVEVKKAFAEVAEAGAEEVTLESLRIKA